jgi:uncharacterized protein YcbX
MTQVYHRAPRRNAMHVAGLNIFPLKSARGIAVDTVEVEARGPVGDRRWMMIDRQGLLVTQRELPQLALLAAEPIEAGLRLGFGGETLDIARPPAGTPRVPATVWRDTLPLPEAAPAAAWLSRLFGVPLRLVYQPDDAVRPVNPEWSADGDEVSLADGFPLLVATTASLAAVERAVGEPMEMRRFRPNLVIDGAEPWEEDRWATIRVGPVELDLVKPCARCTVPTVDPDRGEFAGDEPLGALRRLRLSADRRVPGVLFGWNAIPRRLGAIRLGDPVEVAAWREATVVRPPRAAAERSAVG